jgi:hypothetical protein
MASGIGVKPQKLPLRIREPQPFVATELFLALILIGSSVAILVPSLPLRAAVILVWGILIFSYERYLGLPAPVTPGTMLWLGSTLSYVVGGLGTIAIYGASDGFGLRYLDTALLYLGLGLAAYAIGLRLVGQHYGPIKPRPTAVFELTFRASSVWLIAALFILPVVVRSIITEIETFTVYNNLVVGALQSIEKVPMILLAFYVMQSHRRWWLGLLLLAATLAVPWEGIILGYGRSKLPFAFIALALTWLSLVWFSGKHVSQRGKLLFASLSIFLVIFFGISTAYRHEVRFDRSLTGNERLAIVQGSTMAVVQSGSIIIDSGEPLIKRLVELPSLELLGWANEGLVARTGWTLGDSKQVVLSWVPKVFFPEKGQGYGRDIMEYYELSPSWNNIPVTILTDIYRRLGLAGVLGLYFFMGIASTSIAIKLLPRWGALSLIFLFYFALLHLDIYSSDVLAVFRLYIYRFPSSVIVIYLILRITQIWRPQKSFG